MRKTSVSKTGIVGASLTILTFVGWIIQRIADLDFVIQTINDPNWIGKTVNWFSEDPDRMFGLFMVLGLFISLYAYRKSQKPDKENPATEVPIIKPSNLQPDWKIVDAMDFIAAIYGNATEEDLDKKYLEPTRLLTSKARSGEIQVWGKRIFDDDNAELSQRQMKQSDWEDIELSIWACTTSAGHSHTEPASQQEVQQFTDLHVNESQIKDIRWQSEDIERRYPERIHRVVDHVSLRIDDSNSGNCYLATRHALRVAARDGRIALSGKKRKPDKRNPSKLATPIPADFWNDQELTKYATEDQYRHFIHTEPEIDSNSQRIGERREQYWEVTAIMSEINEIWP